MSSSIQQCPSAKNVVLSKNVSDWFESELERLLPHTVGANGRRIYPIELKLWLLKALESGVPKQFLVERFELPSVQTIHGIQAWYHNNGNNNLTFEVMSKFLESPKNSNCSKEEEEMVDTKSEPPPPIAHSVCSDNLIRLRKFHFDSNLQGYKRPEEPFLRLGEEVRACNGYRTRKTPFRSCEFKMALGRARQSGLFKTDDLVKRFGLENNLELYRISAWYTKKLEHTVSTHKTLDRLTLRKAEEEQNKKMTKKERLRKLKELAMRNWGGVKLSPEDTEVLIRRTSNLGGVC